MLIQIILQVVVQKVLPTDQNLVEFLVLLRSRLAVLRLVRLVRLLVGGVVGRVGARDVAVRLGSPMVRAVALQLLLHAVMRAHLGCPILLTASVLGAMLEVLDGALALDLCAVLRRALFVLVLVGRHLLHVRLVPVGLRLILLNDSVYLILQALVLLEYLIVAFYLFLVRVDVLHYVHPAAVQLRDVNVRLAAASAMHVLLARRLLLVLVNLLLRAVHL